ncbi:MAG: serine/threonine-protein kinase [Planctomycetota bacterium]
MTADADADERAQRLADLTEALRARAAASPEDGAAAAPLDDTALEALAAAHGVTREDVRACVHAVATLRRCLQPNLPPALDPAVLPDTYEVLGELGRGGMGVVFRARHRALDREIAVKVLRPSEQALADLLRRFEVEAKSLARLRHPHIVAVHDVGRNGGHVYYTMDLIDGTSLDKVLRDEPLSPSRAVRLLLQVASAIEHSHEHGVIHRDLKPANILLDRSDRAFVADFGLARDMNVRVELTTTGQILGTPAYMSPESMRGESTLVGERSDVWALGAVLYECLGGTSPFLRRNLADTMHAVLHEDPVPLRKRNPRVPSDLALVCDKALAKNPDERYATARALREDLERFQQGLPVLAQRPDLRRRCLRWLQRNRAAVVGAAAAAAVVATVMTLARPRPASPEVIDAMIRVAAGREQRADYAEAALLYDHARGVLGSDASRPLRNENGGTSDALVDQIWRGILQCQVELAWQKERAGDAQTAAREFASWLERCPPDAATFWRSTFRGELVALYVLAGTRAAAQAALSDAAHATDTPHDAATAWRVVGHRLRDVWASPGDRAWRDAGRILAQAFALASEGVLGDLQLGEFDATPALASAWAAAADLDPGTRGRVLVALRAHALGSATPLQWGGPHPASVRALAGVADDRGLPSACRREALDLLCAAADLPWRPGGNEEFERAADALALAVRCAELAPEASLRQRLAFAVACWRERRDDARVDVADWLSAHTGAPADTDFAAFLAAHGEESPSAWLAAALGAAATADGTATAERFAAVHGAARAWLHQWLTLTRDAAVRAPVWPSGEAEPDNLVATWHHGVRRADDRLELTYAFDRFDADGRQVDNRMSTTTWLELGRLHQTWFGSDLTMGEFSPWAAAVRHTPRMQLRLPGTTDVGGRGPNPFQRVNLTAQIVLADRLQLQWSASVDNPPDFARASGALPPVPLDDLGVWFVDDWSGGQVDERAGCCVLTVNARRRPAPDAGAARDEEDAWSRVSWRAHVARQVRAAQQLARTGAPPRALIDALGLLPTDRRAPIDMLARVALPELLPALRELDGVARRLRDDPTTLADLEALHRVRDDLGGAVSARGQLGRTLAGRLLCGDAAAIAEPDFASRLDEAVAGLGLGASWWFRVLRAADDDGLRALALGHLAALDVATPLLRRLANTDVTALPAALQAQVDRAETVRDRVRRRIDIVVLALAAALLGTVVVGATIALRRSAASRWSTPVALVCALLSLATFVCEARYGTWRLPPAALGLGGLGLAAVLLARQCRGAPAVATLAAAGLAFAAGLAADTQWHEYANGIASVLAAGALALFAVQVGRVLPRWRLLAYVPALLLGTAAIGGAVGGVRALWVPNTFETFEHAVAALDSPISLRIASLLGCVALAVLLLATLLAPGPSAADRGDRSQARGHT